MAAAPSTRTKAQATNVASWRDVAPAGVVLVGGPEEYLGIRAMDHIRSQVRAAFPDVEISHLTAGIYEPGALAMNVSPSLFGERKLIEVEGVEAMNDAFLADALAYLAHPEPDGSPDADGGVLPAGLPLAHRGGRDPENLGGLIDSDEPVAGRRAHGLDELAAKVM